MRKIYYILLLLLVISSCEDKWDNFYGEGEDDDRSATSKQTLWELIDQESNYSKFKQLLEETKLAEELHKGRILTVWLPSDNYITEEIMTLDSIDMRRFVLNHINPLALYKTKLGTKNEIETLAKKYLRIDGRGNNVNVEKIKVAKFDMVCTNGVIHEIAGILTPIKNVMEYLMESGSEYSVYRDSLLAYNDTVFNLEDSDAIGVNEFGQTIYDSLFDITNTLLGSIDFDDERGGSTLFLPSNDVIDEMLEDLNTFYKLLGVEMKKQDTLDCFEFLMRATYLGSERTNISGSKSIYTAGGKELRMDKQILSTVYEQCSNGVVYEFLKAYLPRNQFMKTILYEPYTLFELPDNEMSKYYQLPNNGVLNEDDNIFINPGGKEWGEFLEVIVDDTKKESIDLVLMQKDIYGDIIPAKLMPGKYKMTGKGFGWRSAHVKIYLNGQALVYKRPAADHVGSFIFPMGTNDHFNYHGDNYKDMCDTITVGISPGNDVIRIETTGEGSQPESIKIRALKFEPVGDNY